MNTESFCYWLQGYFEISKSNILNESQVEEIKNHLQLVFKKETPTVTTIYGSSFPLNLQSGTVSNNVWCGPGLGVGSVVATLNSVVLSGTNISC